MANKRLIDANAEICKMKDVLTKMSTGERSFAVETIIAGLERAPTVDAVEVVHGRWIRRIVDYEKPLYWKEECSICGFDGDAYAFLYCPNCGAKMDGGNEDD